MMKKKINNGIFYVVISLVAVLAIGSVVVAYNGYGTPKVVVEGNYIEAPTGEVSVIEPEVGAVSGPDITSPYVSFNGVTYWFASSGTTPTATTTCELRSPSATSTLVFASFEINEATTTALLVEMGKSSSRMATTTLVGTAYTVPANANALLIASTTPSGTGSVTFTPNQYLNVKIGSSNGIGFDEGGDGTCKAVWIEN